MHDPVLHITVSSQGVAEMGEEGGGWAAGSAWCQDPQINPAPLQWVLCSKAKGRLDLFSLTLPMATECLEQP